jgi:hypothetical protein
MLVDGFKAKAGDDLWQNAMLQRWHQAIAKDVKEMNHILAAYKAVLENLKVDIAKAQKQAAAHI